MLIAKAVGQLHTWAHLRKASSCPSPTQHRMHLLGAVKSLKRKVMGKTQRQILESKGGAGGVGERQRQGVFTFNFMVMF